MEKEINYYFTDVDKFSQKIQNSAIPRGLIFYTIIQNKC